MWTIDYLESHGEQRAPAGEAKRVGKSYTTILCLCFGHWFLVFTKFHLRGRRSAKELEIFDSLKSNNLFRAIILASELDEHQILKQFGPQAMGRSTKFSRGETYERGYRTGP